MYTRMLIPLDGSKTAENVLPYGRILARTFQIPVELMEVLDIAGMASHSAMATHGGSGMTRWLLGSIAEKVLRATTNPLK